MNADTLKSIEEFKGSLSKAMDDAIQEFQILLNDNPVRREQY
jgi:hypothetical protein